jgi:tetratricopeptide (TPR) repeat protein
VKIVVVVFLFIISLDCLPESQSPSLDLHDLKSLALQGGIYSLRGEYDLAESYYREAVSKNPNEVAMQYRLAQTFFFKGEYRKALAGLHNINDSDFLPAREFMYGNIYHRLGDCRRARIHYNRLASIVLPLGVTELTALLVKADEFDDKSYTQTVRCILKDDEHCVPNANFVYAMCLARQGDITNALANIDRAIELEPLEYQYFFFRGILSVFNGSYEEAIRSFEMAIELNPMFVLGVYQKGLVQQLVGKSEDATQTLSHAINLHPSLAIAYLSRGELYDYQKKYAKALEDYMKACDLQPDSFNAHYKVAKVEEKIGLQGKAMETYSKALNCEPISLSDYRHRGDLYLENGDYEQAVSDFTKIIQMNASDKYAILRRGVALAKGGKFDLALHDFNKIQGLTCDPAYLRLVYYYRTAIWCETKEYDLAWKSLRLYKELNPSSKWAAEKEVWIKEKVWGKGHVSIFNTDTSP